MDARKNKAQLKTDVRRVFRALDFAGKHISGESPPKATQNTYFNIYQALGLAWEFLGLQCKHWDGYKRNRDGKQVCRICGKIKGVQEGFFLLTDSRMKKIGRGAGPTSKKTLVQNRKTQTSHGKM